jgi:hypothetical protein
MAPIISYRKEVEMLFVVDSKYGVQVTNEEGAIFFEMGKQVPNAYAVAKALVAMIDVPLNDDEERLAMMLRAVLEAGSPYKAALTGDGAQRYADVRRDARALLRELSL